MVSSVARKAGFCGVLHPWPRTSWRGKGVCVGVFIRNGERHQPLLQPYTQACPHPQKTILYSHCHFLVTIIIHVLPSNRPHLGRVLCVSQGFPKNRRITTTLKRQCAQNSFLLLLLSIFRSPGAWLIQTQLNYCVLSLFLISYPFVGPMGCACHVLLMARTSGSIQTFQRALGWRNPTVTSVDTPPGCGSNPCPGMEKCTLPPVAGIAKPPAKDRVKNVNNPAYHWA